MKNIQVMKFTSDSRISNKFIILIKSSVEFVKNMHKSLLFQIYFKSVRSIFLKSLFQIETSETNFLLILLALQVQKFIIDEVFKIKF